MSPTLVIVGVGLYTILMFAIGFWGYGKSRPSMEDFFLGGRTLGLFVVLCTVWSTLFSAYSYIGLPGAYYRTGISFFGLAGNILLNSLCMYLLGSRMWTLGKKHGFINMTDLFAERYGSNLVCVIAMIISIGSLLPYIGLHTRVSSGDSTGFIVGIGVRNSDDCRSVARGPFARIRSRSRSQEEKFQWSVPASPFGGH